MVGLMVGVMGIVMVRSNGAVMVRNNGGSFGWGEIIL